MAVSTRPTQFGVPVKGKAVRLRVRGRVCQAEGCTTVLSVYNDSDDCSLHSHGKMKFARDRS